jgi:hypothetical protein
MPCPLDINAEHTHSVVEACTSLCHVLSMHATCSGALRYDTKDAFHQSCTLYITARQQQQQQNTTAQLNSTAHGLTCNLIPAGHQVDQVPPQLPHSIHNHLVQDGIAARCLLAALQQQPIAAAQGKGGNLQAGGHTHHTHGWMHA